MATAPKPAPRAFTFLQTRQLGVAWLTSVILGALVISSNPGITPPRMVIPVAIMIIYGVFVFNKFSALFPTASEAYRSSIIAQLADSLYFMGFVWTLWALIDSFVIHKINAADAIFRSFGYALVTTAAGMFFRLAILQFKYTAAEQSQGAQESVEEALQKFSTVLHATRGILERWHADLITATTAIGSANAGLIASVETARNELTKTITAAKDTYLELLGSTLAELQKQVQATSGTIETAIRDAIAGGLKDFGQRTSANLDQIREATTGLVATLKRTNTGLGKSITDLTVKVDETVQRVDIAADAFANGTQRVTTEFHTTTGRLTAATLKFESTVQSAQASITAATAAMAQSMKGLSEQIKEEIKLGLDGIVVSPRVPVTVDDAVVQSAIAPVVAHLQALGTQASEIHGLIRTEAGKAATTQETLQRVDKTLETAVATISGRLEGLKAELERPMFGRLFGR